MLDFSVEDCPTHFYKYRSLKGDSLEYTRKILFDNELWFPAPRTFNDPFDTWPTFSFDSTADERAALYARQYRCSNPHWSEDKCLAQAAELANNPVIDPHTQEARDHMQKNHTHKVRDKIGVLCLCKDPDNILMWSHYADEHRGVCLKFDGYYPFFAQAQKVEYPPQRRAVNPFRDLPDEQMAASVLHKYDGWVYESEWRIVDYQDGPGARSFPESSLIGIIMGASISPTNELTVRRWHATRAPSLTLERAVASKNTYELRIEPAS